MDRIINKEATIQNVLKWANRSNGHSITIDKFNEYMARADWEKSLVEIARGCCVEIVYYKRLSEINPQIGEFYSVLDVPNEEERLLAVIIENDSADFIWARIETQHLFDPIQLTKEEAKSQLRQEMDTLKPRLNEGSEAKKEYSKIEYDYMEAFYEKYFPS